MRGISITRAIITLTLMLTGSLAPAQGQFSPAIIVNGDVISHFELEQRERMLGLFRTPGDLGEVARDQLIEDRLKQSALNQAGLRITDEGLQLAMEEFAARANLPLEDFIQLLGQNGVEQNTLRDFVRIGISWRDFVRSRFGDRAQISEAEIDRALGQNQNASSGIEVLLSEIIIPAPPPRAAQALATATRISGFTSTSAFESAARQYSALPSKGNGGRLGWLPITNYPPQLRSLILNLGTGQVTAPIQITNGVALFQMRGVREVRQAPLPPAAIEYAAYYLAGGRSDAGLRAAQTLANQIDTCDDLYGEAYGQPAEVLERNSLPPAEIPQDVALELARLDPGEVSYNLTRSNGETLVFLMLCGRSAATEGEVDRDTVRAQLRSRRLSGYANALLEDLRASATITTP